MKKIALVGLRWIHNIGDPLVFECTEWICRNLAKETFEYKYLDIRGFRELPWNYIDNISKNNDYKLNFKSKLKKYIKLYFPTIVTNYKFTREIRRFEQRDNWITVKEYLKKELSDACGVIVIAAGTIIYDGPYQYSTYYKMLIDVIKENYNIPIFISGAGIEDKYKWYDARAIFFSKILSDPAVKMITTRNDFAGLKEYVKNKATYIEQVADAGTWASECFGINKDKSNIVGIGIISYVKFVEFKQMITRELYEKEIENILNELTSMGIEWKLFNNGSLEDDEYMHYIAQKNNISENRLVSPSNPKELTKTISGFKGIIASRLHACIVAYSLGVPFVAISWNEKLQFFARDIGVSSRVITAERFVAKEVVTELESAIRDGYDKGKISDYKETVVNSINQFIKSYLGEDI